jgi:hypothetical protein
MHERGRLVAIVHAGACTAEAFKARTVSHDARVTGAHESAPPAEPRADWPQAVWGRPCAVYKQRQPMSGQRSTLAQSLISQQTKRTPLCTGPAAERGRVEPEQAQGDRTRDSRAGNWAWYAGAVCPLTRAWAAQQLRRPPHGALLRCLVSQQLTRSAA